MCSKKSMESNNAMIDHKLNCKYLHTKPIYSSKQLSDYYNEMNIDKDNLSNIRGLERYIFENGEKPIAKTLQGYVYIGIDITTGRRVIIKSGKKCLVNKNLCRNGQMVYEDLRKEAKLVWKISNPLGHTNAGFAKFVEFFENEKNYYLVTEHGGIELLSYIRETHPFNEKNEAFNKQWRQYIQYHFRFIAKCIDFLHNDYNIAHCDLSLENMVIDDTICRIIDFGLAKQRPKNGKLWKCDKFVGKTLYQSPEIREIKKQKGDNIEMNELMYDPQSADIWALGVMLFIMLAGAQPWHIAESSDQTFDLIFNQNKIKFVLKQWDSTDYFDKDSLDLLSKIFVYEKDRINISGILNHPYVKNAPRSLVNNVETQERNSTELNHVSQGNKDCNDIVSVSVSNENNNNNNNSKQTQRQGLETTCNMNSDNSLKIEI